MTKKTLDFYLDAPIKKVAQHALDTTEAGEAIATMSCLNVRAYIDNQNAYIANQKFARWTIGISILSFMLSVVALVVTIFK